MQWLIFILLFNAAALGLELAEGSKITTTEYYGYHNIGFTFVALMFLSSCVLYPVALLPLSMLISKLVRAVLVRVLLYCMIGIVGGVMMFNQLYDNLFIQEYGLNRGTAMLLFGVVGVIYALLDQYLQHRSQGRIV